MVYVDLLILSNFLLDYSLITYTGHLTKESINVYRIVFATMIAVSSLLLFYVQQDALFILLRFIYSLLIIYVAFSYSGLKKYIVNLSIFYVLNFILAGLLLSFNVRSSYINIDFFNLNVWILLVFSFILANILTYILKVSLINSNYSVQVKFKLLDKEYQCYGFIDTGNDAIGNHNLPVVFINQQFIKEEIDERFLEEHTINYHYMECNTIHTRNQILVFKPNYFKVLINKKYYNFDVYISLLDGTQTTLQNYKVILNKNLLF